MSLPVGLDWSLPTRPLNPPAGKPFPAHLSRQAEGHAAASHLKQDNRDMHRCQTLVLVLLRELLARIQYLGHFLRKLAWVHATCL
jgi:hypothetical protein